MEQEFQVQRTSKTQLHMVFTKKRKYTLDWTTMESKVTHFCIRIVGKVIGQVSLIFVQHNKL